jgi:hypothetical protein
LYELQRGEGRSVACDGYLKRLEKYELVSDIIVQFQPREFSAIIGAEIYCVRAELPVRPLPLLFLS